MLLSELTNTVDLLIVYVHRNEEHFTYIYVYHTNVFEADNIYKKTSPNCHFTNLFAICFRFGAPLITLLNAGVLTDLQLPATASNVCTADEGWVASAGCPPPNKNPGYAGV